MKNITPIGDSILPHNSVQLLLNWQQTQGRKGQYTYYFMNLWETVLDYNLSCSGCLRKSEVHSLNCILGAWDK